MKVLIDSIKRFFLTYKFKKANPHLSCNYNDIIFNNVLDYGNGNKILIGKESSINSCNITFWGNNCILELKEKVHLKNINFWFEDEKGKIIIGSETSMESGCQFASVEGTEIIVGNDCMFSHDIDVRSTDSHSIINLQGDRINPSENIVIGDHVWVGIRSTILKGSKIKPNSIVAACSLVTASTKVDSNCILAGVPAKIIKTEVSWKRERI